MLSFSAQLKNATDLMKVVDFARSMHVTTSLDQAVNNL